MSQNTPQDAFDAWLSDRIKHVESRLDSRLHVVDSVILSVLRIVRESYRRVRNEDKPN